MGRKISIFLCLVTISIMSHGQAADQIVRNCVINAGENARYLKDFRIQLGTGASQGELRYKAKISLWKNTKYRFTLCNSEVSKGQLILNLKDDANKLVASSYDERTGKTYQFIDFRCNKSGIYKLDYDFKGSQKGLGVGIVSMIK